MRQGGHVSLFPLAPTATSAYDIGDIVFRCYFQEISTHFPCLYAYLIFSQFTLSKTNIGD